MNRSFYPWSRNRAPLLRSHLLFGHSLPHTLVSKPIFSPTAFHLSTGLKYLQILLLTYPTSISSLRLVNFGNRHQFQALFQDQAAAAKKALGEDIKKQKNNSNTRFFNLDIAKLTYVETFFLASIDNAFLSLVP